MKFLFSFLFLLNFKQSNAQTVNWTNTANWKLYAIRKSAALRYSSDTLKFFPFVVLPNDSVLIFLKALRPLPAEKAGVWMGAFIATCERNNRICKIDISMYGGFLYDEREKAYYELPPSKRDEWIDYLNRILERVPYK